MKLHNIKNWLITESQLNTDVNISLNTHSIGDIVKIDGKLMEIVEFTNWVKDKNRNVLSLICKYNNKLYSIIYDDGMDCYVIK